MAASALCPGCRPHREGTYGPSAEARLCCQSGPAVAINIGILSVMEVHESFMAVLPKLQRHPHGAVLKSLAGSVSLAGILRLLITGYKRSMNYDACKHELRCSLEK